MTRNKHIPQRSCVSCRACGDKDNFIRIVIDSNGDAVIDEAKKLPGRGAYLCYDSECVKRARKGRLAGALKSSVKNADLWEKLELLINMRKEQRL